MTELAANLASVREAVAESALAAGRRPGDITLVGESGRLLSVLIMIIGISLFVKLAQAIVRPSKVHVECQVCGLSRHDPDAVHCKHCGSVVHIPREGD